MELSKFKWSAAQAMAANRNFAFTEREFHYFWTCYWYNFCCESLHRQHQQQSESGEPREKMRKMSYEDYSPPSPPSVVTKLKGKPAPGKLFRHFEHCDNRDILQPILPSPASSIHVSSHPCKRRYTGAPLVKHRMTSSSSNAGRHQGKTSVFAEVVTQSSSQPANLSRTADGMTTIRHVLPECLSRIFEYLDVTSKGKAAQVCRSWREACYEKSVWRNVEAKLHIKKTSPSTLYQSLVTRGIKRVQVLSLRKSLRELINGIPNLESLNLSGCYNLSDQALEVAFSVKDAPMLKTLNLSLCKEVSDSSLNKIAFRCKNLEDLDLAGCSKVTNAGMFYVSMHLKHLKRLNLRSCRQISDYGIAHLSGQNTSTHGSSALACLESLGLQDCQKLTDEGLKHISVGLPKVKSMNLSFCVSVTDTGIKSVARMAPLEELNLRSCDNVSDIGIGFLADDLAGKSLQHLDASFCANVTDSAAKHIAAGVPNLRSLSLANCAVSDDGLTRIAKSLKKLEALNIGQCKSVTDKSLLIVAKEMVSLKRIDLYGCSNVTEKALQKIRLMPKIADLNLQLHMS